MLRCLPIIVPMVHKRPRINIVYILEGWRPIEESPQRSRESLGQVPELVIPDWIRLSRIKQRRGHHCKSDTLRVWVRAAEFTGDVVRVKRCRCTLVLGNPSRNGAPSWKAHDGGVKPSMWKCIPRWHRSILCAAPFQCERAAVERSEVLEEHRVCIYVDPAVEEEEQEPEQVWAVRLMTLNQMGGYRVNKRSYSITMSIFTNHWQSDVSPFIFSWELYPYFVGLWQLIVFLRLGVSITLERTTYNLSTLIITMTDTWQAVRLP